MYARLDAYTARFEPHVRDLAEVVSIATKGGAERDFLTDSEDTRCTVFTEMVSLYRDRYDIGSALLEEAVREFEAIG